MTLLQACHFLFNSSKTVFFIIIFKCALEMWLRSTHQRWRGVYIRNLAPARVSYQDDFLISYCVYMMTGSFYIAFIWRSTSYRHIRHALPVPVYRQIDFTLKGVVVSRLRDTVAKFRSGTTTGVNSSRCDSRLHDILWVLQLVRGKQIQSCETPPWLTV